MLTFDLHFFARSPPSGIDQISLLSLTVFHISSSLPLLLITMTLTASTQEAFELHTFLYNHKRPRHCFTKEDEKPAQVIGLNTVAMILMMYLRQSALLED